MHGTAVWKPRFAEPRRSPVELNPELASECSISLFISFLPQQHMVSWFRSRVFLISLKLVPCQGTICTHVWLKLVIFLRNHVYRIDREAAREHTNTTMHSQSRHVCLATTSSSRGSVPNSQIMTTLTKC